MLISESRDRLEALDKFSYNFQERFAVVLGTIEKTFSDSSYCEIKAFLALKTKLSVDLNDLASL